MIKQLFKNKGIKVTNQEFEEILKMTTDDIRENRIKFGKITSLNEIIDIAYKSYKVLKRAIEGSMNLSYVDKDWSKKVIVNKKRALIPLYKD